MKETIMYVDKDHLQQSQDIHSQHINFHLSLHQTSKFVKKP